MPATVPPNLNAEDVIRHLTHELRQPLSALEAIAYYLQMKMGESGPDVCAQVMRLEQMVYAANWVVTDVLHLLPMTPPKSVAVEVEELAGEVLAEEWVSEGLAIEQEFDGEMAPAQADEEQLRHLIRSVFVFLRRSAEDVGPVRVTGNSVEGAVRLEICARGGNLDTEAMFRPLAANQLFTCQRIAENNAGAFRAEKGADGRLRLLLELPVAAMA